jgi:hypothetical protein
VHVIVALGKTSRFSVKARIMFTSIHRRAHAGLAFHFLMSPFILDRKSEESEFD